MNKTLFRKGFHASVTAGVIQSAAIVVGATRKAFDRDTARLVIRFAGLLLDEIEANEAAALQEPVDETKEAA